MLCRDNKCILRELSQNHPSVCQQLGLAVFDVSKTIEASISELIAAKRAANKREVYLKSLESYLRRFSDGRADQHINTFTSADISNWLDQFKSPNSRQTWLNRISTLFSWCVKQGLVAANPCDRVERVTIDRKAPLILTPEQATLLLAACDTICKPWLILAMYAGIRPDGELMKMDWKDIDPETGTAKVNFPKVRKYRRIVKLEALTVSLLKDCPLKSGPIAPSASTLRRFKRRMRAVLGLKAWPQDILRHTAASYLMALHKDAGKVATMLGNSVQILLTHYHDPVTDAACALFWSLANKEEASRPQNADSEPLQGQS